MKTISLTLIFAQICLPMVLTFRGTQYRLVVMPTIRSKRWVCHIHQCHFVYVVRKQAQVIAAQVAETLSSITAALNIHLNMGQNTIMNTSSVFVSLETASIASLSNKIIEQVGNAQIRIPSSLYSTLNNDASVSLRVSYFVFSIFFIFSS